MMINYRQNGDRRLSREQERQIIRHKNIEKEKIFNIAMGIPRFPDFIYPPLEYLEGTRPHWKTHIDIFRPNLNSASELNNNGSSNGKYGDYIRKIVNSRLFPLLVDNEYGHSIVNEMNAKKSFNGTAQSLKSYVDKKMMDVNILVDSQQDLVKIIAKSYSNLNYHMSENPNIEFSDLVNEGNWGLFSAAENAENRKTNRFSTYAAYWIKCYMMMAIIKGSNDKLGLDAAKKYFAIMRYKDEIYRRTGEDATIRELADLSNLPKKKVSEYMILMNQTFSLDEKTHKNYDVPRIDIIADDKMPSPFSAVCGNDLSEKLTAELDRLDRKARDMIKMKYAIGYDREHTFKEIGEKYKYKGAKQRAKQIIEKNLKKMAASYKVREILYQFVSS